MENSNSYKYQKAKERMECIKGFYGNLLAYCIVIPVLAYINIKTGNELLWFLFPALGWGIGLLAHGMNAYGYNPILGKNWEERKIKEFMQNDSN
ncbi:2TM domain-containing protein [Allomuricauda sp. d1]|uniref:2TM domain-containing protein n=1 Tax=Allomuricauda sp. d1 TaxID=3136725 RepID=UPI0031D1427E